MIEITVDAAERAAVKRYIQSALEKPEAERIAFNEGVMCAAFALGAYIDGTRGLNADAHAVLERAFTAITGLKAKVTHQIGPAA